MAACRRVDDLVTCGLTGCTPGSAPGPTLGNEYGRTLPLPLTELKVPIVVCICGMYVCVTITVVENVRLTC